MEVVKSVGTVSSKRHLLDTGVDALGSSEIEAALMSEPCDSPNSTYYPYHPPFPPSMSPSPSATTVNRSTNKVPLSRFIDWCHEAELDFDFITACFNFDPVFTFCCVLTLFYCMLLF